MAAADNRRQATGFSSMVIVRLLSRFIAKFFPPVLVIALAYFSAVLASAATYIIFVGTLRHAESLNIETFCYGLLLYSAGFAVLFAIPAACAALVAWEKGYRNVFYYAATWGAGGLVLSAIPPMFPDIHHDAFSHFKWLVWTVTGAAGGTIYWIVAGRFTRVVKAKRHVGYKPPDDHYSKR